MSGAETNEAEPRVSVVMTVYDAERFLAQAIESILGQTLRELELIIVDDGSRDGSLAIARHHAERDARVRLTAIPHAGIAPATNRGIAQARAPLIACMDADDVARPDRLAKQVAFLERHPEVGVVGGQIEVIDRDGRFVRRSAFPLAPEQIREQMTYACVVWHPTALMRREVLHAVGGYREDFDCAVDFDLWLRLLEHTELANLPDVVLDYRWHGDNVSIRKHRRQFMLTLAAIASAIGRRRLGFDPWTQPSDAPTLDEIEAMLPDEASRLEWLAVIYLLVSRHGAGADDRILAWLDRRTRGIPRRTRERHVLDELSRAHLNRVAAFVGEREPVAALRHLGRAFESSPRVVLTRMRARITERLTGWRRSRR